MGRTDYSLWTNLGKSVKLRDMTMAERPNDDPVMRELGENLTRLQEASGYSLKYLERAVVEILQDRDSPTHETIRQYHAGAGTAARANLGLIAALCVVYETPMAEVSPEFARRAEALAKVIGNALDAAPIRTMWPYTQLALYLDDFSPDREREQWKTFPSSTHTEIPSERADCPSQPSAVTASSTPPLRDGSLVAA